MTAIQPFHRVVAETTRLSQSVPAPAAAANAEPACSIDPRDSWTAAAALLRFRCLALSPRYHAGPHRAP